VLYRAEEFEPLIADSWDEGRARDGIAEIVRDTDDALRGPKLLWRAVEWDSWHATSPMKNLYVGAAGVIWALDVLRTRGHAETRLDLADLATRTLELNRTRPDLLKGIPLPAPPESGLFMGETGILLVAWRLAQSRDLEDALLARVNANVDNEAEELMWGTPGTLLAARVMLGKTDDARWQDACRASAEALWSRRDEDGLWVQRLYGQELRSLTPPHGLVGNVEALLPHVDAERGAALRRGTAAVLARAAFVEDGLANWPPRERPDLPGPDGQFRLQWCAGAPGILVSAGSYLDEELLLASAELIWKAGPHGLEKGPGICHGTAGNGYALLAAHERTGDELWLERARRFAMHALDQVRRLRSERGRGRYSLWTGDIGAALFVADCVDSRAAYPLVGSWDW